MIFIKNALLRLACKEWLPGRAAYGPSTSQAQILNMETNMKPAHKHTQMHTNTHWTHARTHAHTHSPSNRLSEPSLSRHWMWRGMKSWARSGSPYRYEGRAKGTSSTGTNRNPHDAAFLCQVCTWGRQSQPHTVTHSSPNTTTHVYFNTCILHVNIAILCQPCTGGHQSRATCCYTLISNTMKHYNTNILHIAIVRSHIE